MPHHRRPQPSPSEPQRFQELLQLASSGDEQARNDIHRQFAPALARFIRTIVGPVFLRHTSVDEVSQETLLKVFNDLEALSEQTTPTMFRNRLYRNARWIVQTMARRARRFAGESEAPVQQAEGSPAPAADPVCRTGTVTRQDELEWMRRLVSSLRPQYAEIIERRMSGMGFAEIASQLDCSVETARKRYSRAVDLLQQILRERGEILS